MIFVEYSVLYAFVGFNIDTMTLQHAPKQNYQLK